MVLPLSRWTWVSRLMTTETGRIPVEGLDELERKLDQLKEIPTLKKTIRSALMFASTPMLKAAKANLAYLEPDTNDVHIRDSIGRQVRFTPGGDIVAELRLGEKKKKVTINGKKRTLVYGHILEFGGFPWLRPAFDSNMMTFINRFKEKLSQLIDKVTKND